MSQIFYVLIVLFVLSDGSIGVMRTSQTFTSPLSCSMQAFLENEATADRTYVCVAHERSIALAGQGVELAEILNKNGR